MLCSAQHHALVPSKHTKLELYKFIRSTKEHTYFLCKICWLPCFSEQRKASVLQLWISVFFTCISFHNTCVKKIKQIYFMVKRLRSQHTLIWQSEHLNLWVITEHFQPIILTYFDKKSLLLSIEECFAIILNQQITILYYKAKSLCICTNFVCFSIMWKAHEPLNIAMSYWPRL